MKFLVVAALTLGSLTLNADPVRSESAVERFVRLLGGSIPFPPEKIIRTLSAKGVSPFGIAVMPHGRSLQRRATDYQNPRSMISFYMGSGQPNRDAHGFVFVAYTPNLEQLEIIGGTETLPNDFLVVHNYRLGASNFRPVPPSQGVGLCLACHQNGGPIFPVAPWSETNESDAMVAKLHQLTLDPFAVSLTGQSARVRAFDESVRIVTGSPCMIGGECGNDLPSGALSDRFPIGSEYKIDAGPHFDPLIPRLSDSGVDTFKNVSPKWSISLTRDGATSFPSYSEKKLFHHYCASCHDGPNAVAPPLPLGNFLALKNYVGAANRTVKGLLDGKIMPPISSPLPSPMDRDRMSKALQ